MKNHLQFLVLYLIALAPLMSSAQFSLHNFGNIKMHENAQMGFHEDLINDGSFDENLGLAGFYNDDSALISGAFRPIFNDLEVVVTNNLFLEVGLGVTNNSNFVLGNIITPRDLPDVNLAYIGDATYNGDSQLTKVDGYSSINNKKNFIFPVGIEQDLRPLKIESTGFNNAAKVAYFRENPNSPSTFTTYFDTAERTDILIAISNQEFWALDAVIPTKITLTWNTDSDLRSFIDDLENIRIVGWNSDLAIWEDLGNTNYTGDYDSGEITSEQFFPEAYTIVTFGSSLSASSIDLDNVILTPNGDGVNDYLHFDAVSISPNNHLSIFNRWGRSVYEENNYTNLFNGRSNVNHIVKSSATLPAGIYFYIINLHDISLKHQGYLYIEQE